MVFNHFLSRKIIRDNDGTVTYQMQYLVVDSFINLCKVTKADAPLDDEVPLFFIFQYIMGDERQSQKYIPKEGCILCYI